MSATTRKASPTPADCFIDLWPIIAQLEAVLGALDEELMSVADKAPKGQRTALERALGLLGAAETVADVLATKCRVR